MTEKQLKSFYFPNWRRCCQANDWIVVKGRMLESARREDPSAEEMAIVWAKAENASRKGACKMTEDHLRHACHVVALGADKSATVLTNGETNRIVDFFNYLRDPENLDNVMSWQNAGLSERRSMISYIKRRAPEEYICDITRDKFGTIWWEDLEMIQLKSLAGILAHRNAQFRAPLVGRGVPAEPSLIAMGDPGSAGTLRPTTEGAPF